MKSSTRNLTLALCGAAVVALSACSDEPVRTISDAQPNVAPTVQTAQPAEDLEQLLAPIALYPDELVAQVLTASTYPTEVVDAWQWLQRHLDLNGKALADAVDAQPWDPSVKALTQLPSVLQNMDENLAWTSELGDAYVNGRDDVMSTVQTLRWRAEAAGTLRSTSQQAVTTQDQTIAIEPASPDVVYVPEYNPWLVYGAPLVAYPDWVAVPGVFYTGLYPYFGIGFDIGPWVGLGWGWHNWAPDWHRHEIRYREAPYFTHSPTFFDRHSVDTRSHFDRRDEGFARPVERVEHPREFQAPASEFQENVPEFHAPAREFTGRFKPRADGALRTGAFSGFDHGGIARAYASRGASSFGARRGGGIARGGFADVSREDGGFRGGGHRR